MVNINVLVNLNLLRLNYQQHISIVSTLMDQCYAFEKTLDASTRCVDKAVAKGRHMG